MYVKIILKDTTKIFQQCICIGIKLRNMNKNQEFDSNTKKNI